MRAFAVMLMEHLPITIYATPGRRAFGERGEVERPDKFAGLKIAETLRTEWMEEVHFPTIGFLTVKSRRARS